jgi:pyocin large subunit-like protein
MSNEAITWAIRQRVPQSSAKFVLFMLANQANEQGYTYPSIAYLTETTEQDRKTVLSNLAKLCEWGLIEATDQRVGRTRQIVVYRVRMDEDLFDSKSAETGTVPKEERFQKRNSSVSVRNSPVFSGNSPNNGTRNPQEPKACERENAGAGARIDLPEGVDPEKWAKFLEQLEHDGKTSLPRVALALGQLKLLIARGADVNRVLEAAVLRSHRDLVDVARQLDGGGGARAGPQRKGQTGNVTADFTGVNYEK